MFTRPRSDARGIALISTLVLIAIVMAIVTGLNGRLRGEIAQIGAQLDLQRSKLLTRRLEMAASAVLKQDRDSSNIDSLDEDWHEMEISLDDGTARITDLDGMFNLNNLVPSMQLPGGQPDYRPPVNLAAPPAANDSPQSEAGGQDPPPVQERGVPVAAASLPWKHAEAQFRLLLNRLDVDAEIVDAIIDWVDEDSETRYPNGAEDDYYLRLRSPYRTANRPLVDVSELHLVRGVTDDVYESLKRVVVVLPERTAINVNTAGTEVLMSLGPGIDEGTAQQLIDLRDVQPYLSIEAFLQHPAVLGRPLIGDDIAIASRYFMIRTNSPAGTGELVTQTMVRRDPGRPPRIIQRVRGYGTL